jgi:hypothetical protein
VDYATLRAIAVRASVDPRTVDQEIAEPGSVRGLPGHRTRLALREMGIAPDARPELGLVPINVEAK